MKTKKLSKKLYLNKRTVANLNDEEMKILMGGSATDGDTEPQCTCPASVGLETDPTRDCTTRPANDPTNTTGVG